jgi:hypothetical protein
VFRSKWTNRRARWLSFRGRLYRSGHEQTARRDHGKSPQSNSCAAIIAHTFYPRFHAYFSSNNTGYSAKLFTIFHGAYAGWHVKIGRLTIRALIACLISPSATEGLRSLAICEGSLIESVGRQCPHSFGANRFFFLLFVVENIIGTKSSSLFLLTLDFGSLRAQGSYVWDSVFWFPWHSRWLVCCVCVLLGYRWRTKRNPFCADPGNCIAVSASRRRPISNNRKNTLKLPYMLL